MKIVKQGKPANALLEVTCDGRGNQGRGCGTVVRLDKEDVYHYTKTCWDGSSGDSYRIWVCPLCGNWNDLRNSDRIPVGTHRSLPPWPDGTKPEERWRHES